MDNYWIFELPLGDESFHGKQEDIAIGPTQKSKI